MRQAKTSDQGMCACMAIHQFTARKIATVQNSRIDPAETDHWGETASRIVLEPQFDESALLGLGAFSHVEVLFVFDRAVERDRYEPRPSRGRADLPAVGVFAGRGPRRPNRIGAHPQRQRGCRSVPAVMVFVVFVVVGPGVRAVQVVSWQAEQAG